MLHAVGRYQLSRHENSTIRRDDLKGYVTREKIFNTLFVSMIYGNSKRTHYKISKMFFQMAKY